MECLVDIWFKYVKNVVSAVTKLTYIFSKTWHKITIFAIFELKRRTVVVK